MGRSWAPHLLRNSQCPRSLATLMALAPHLQIPADLTLLDPLLRGGQGIQELLSVPLAHQTRIGQHQHAGVCRRANKTPGSLLTSSTASGNE